jgi:hypothetical protein
VLQVISREGTDGYKRTVGWLEESKSDAEGEACTFRPMRDARLNIQESAMLALHVHTDKGADYVFL